MSTSGDDRDTVLQLAKEYISSSQGVAYIRLATLMLLIMNIVTTFDTEVEHIWKRKQSTMTILFYVVRYFPPICTGWAIWSGISYEIQFWGQACHISLWLEQSACILVVQTVAELLMLMRVWALYTFTRRMLIFLGCLLFGRFAMTLWGGVTPLSSLTRLPWAKESIVPLPGCPIIQTSGLYATRIACVYNMMTSAVIFGCLLHQCLARDNFDKFTLGTWRDLFGVRTAQPVVHVLLRDGNAYFLIILCAELILLVAVSVKNAPIAALYAVPPIQAAYSIPATRFVLNLRTSTLDGRSRSLIRPRDIELKECSAVVFAPAPRHFTSGTGSELSIHQG